ncbi:hypothetical protein [Labrenzia sp. VG12]|uniref:hypothetical protein n=1 Tax=Labrenzia sp. VG12 TaxID=2021862 RepID=UPI0012FDDD88|nr:hypothetical protein [Labrenzia sp. VG12]
MLLKIILAVVVIPALIFVDILQITRPVSLTYLLHSAGLPSTVTFWIVVVAYGSMTSLLQFVFERRFARRSTALSFNGRRRYKSEAPDCCCWHLDSVSRPVHVDQAGKPHFSAVCRRDACLDRFCFIRGFLFHPDQMVRGFL